MTFALWSTRYLMVGMAATIRLSEVMTPFLVGTLKSQRHRTRLPDTSMSSMVFLLYVIQFSTFLYYGVPPVGSPHYHILYYTTTGSFLQGGICKYPVQKHLLFFTGGCHAGNTARQKYRNLNKFSVTA